MYISFCVGVWKCVHLGCHLLVQVVRDYPILHIFMVSCSGVYFFIPGIGNKYFYSFSSFWRTKLGFCWFFFVYFFCFIDFCLYLYFLPSTFRLFCFFFSKILDMELQYRFSAYFPIICINSHKKALLYSIQ